MIFKNQKVLRRVLIAALAVVVWCLSFNIFKVKDPDDPRFNPYEFRFTDYTPDELKKVFDRILRPGVDRNFVENVLVSSGGAQIIKLSNDGADFRRFGFYSWQWPPYYNYGAVYQILFLTTGTYRVEVLYDDHQRLVAARSLGSLINNEQLDREFDLESKRVTRRRLNETTTKE